ncbi:MAG TPA: DUF5668 domain-containing protein [Bacteroidota bacterium]|nr:DUF5668 domain-containing protein [Bacteroidota bacterium]
MSRTASRVSLLGLFLIVFGMIILMKKFHLIDMRAGELVWPVLALFGLFMAGRGLADRLKWKIIWGTLLFLYGIFFFLRTLDVFYLPIAMILPATFLIFGITAVMLFVNNPGDWYYLIPGLLLLSIGASLTLSEYGYWYGWEVRQAIKTWWPAALVLFGLGMLLRRRKLLPGSEWRQGTQAADRTGPPEGQ